MSLCHLECENVFFAKYSSVGIVSGLTTLIMHQLLLVHFFTHEGLLGRVVTAHVLDAERCATTLAGVGVF